MKLTPKNVNDIHMYDQKKIVNKKKIWQNKFVCKQNSDCNYCKKKIKSKLKKIVIIIKKKRL